MSTGGLPKENFQLGLFGSPRVTPEQLHTLTHYFAMCSQSEVTRRVLDITMSTDSSDSVIYRSVISKFPRHRICLYPYVHSPHYSFAFLPWKIKDEDEDKVSIVENIIKSSRRLLITYNRDCSYDDNESVMWGMLKAMKLRKKITTVIHENGSVIEFLAQQPTEGRLEFIDGEYILSNARVMTELDYGN